MDRDDISDDVFDEQLHVLLSQRVVPEVRSHLAYSIVEASRGVPQEKVGVLRFLGYIETVFLSFSEGFGSVLDALILPKPAFVMLLVFMMMGGLMMGTYVEDFIESVGGQSVATTVLASSDLGDVETFFMATKSFEYGDFL